MYMYSVIYFYVSVLYYYGVENCRGDGVCMG